MHANNGTKSCQLACKQDQRISKQICRFASASCVNWASEAPRHHSFFVPCPQGYQGMVAGYLGLRVPRHQRTIVSGHHSTHSSGHQHIETSEFYGTKLSDHHGLKMKGDRKQPGVHVLQGPLHDPMPGGPDTVRRPIEYWGGEDSIQAPCPDPFSPVVLVVFQASTTGTAA